MPLVATVDSRIRAADRIRVTVASHLSEHIRIRVGDSGPLPFSTFMSLALYDPDEGFYSRRATPYGDYFTSVSVHPTLFGRMLAVHLDDVWRALGSPDPFRIVELGAVDGRLADQIRSGATDLAWSKTLVYVAVERASNVEMVEAVDTQYHSIAEVEPLEASAIISNEFFDALPVRLVRRTDDGWVEECVDFDGHRAFFTDQPAVTTLLEYAERYARSTPLGGRIEVRQDVDDIYSYAAGLAERIVMTTIDYGGTSNAVHSERLSAGTLMAYRRQQASDDVLANPGYADLTAHVNFSQLIDAGRFHGFTSNRLGVQADFLVALGVGDHLVEVQARGETKLAAYTAERAAVFQLVSPTDLGRFGVLTQGMGADLSCIRGFTDVIE